MSTIRMRLEDPPTAIRPTAPDDATAFRRAAQVAQGDVELWRGKVRVEPIAEA